MPNNSYRSTPAFAIGGIEPKPECYLCGDTAYLIEPLAVRGICSDCCSSLYSHEYEWDTCIICGREVPEPEPDYDYSY